MARPPRRRQSPRQRKAVEKRALAIEDPRSRSGVLDTTSEALEEKIAKRTGGHKPSEFVADGANTTITIALERYRRGDVVREPFATSVTCFGVGMVYKLYPDIAEASGITEAYLFLFKHPGLRRVKDGS